MLDRFRKLVAFLVVFHLVSLEVYAGFESCEDQESCINIVKTEERPFSCLSTQCQYKICIHMLTGTRGCAKSGAISHTCLANPDVCNPSDISSWDEVKSGSPLGEGDVQCQTVEPGATASFILKDGRGCSGSVFKGSIFKPDITCAPTTEQSCTGRGNIGKECLWQIIAPSECSEKENAETPAPVPKNPNIHIEKTVVLGGPTGRCNPGKELVKSNNGAKVTYIYEITNVGDSCLDSVVVTDEPVGYSETLVTFGNVMHPGTQYIRCVSSSIDGNLSSLGRVIGNPVWCDSGDDIDSLDDVTSNDHAGVQEVDMANVCTIDITRTVLPDGSFRITETETCQQCSCPT